MPNYAPAIGFGRGHRSQPRSTGSAALRPSGSSSPSRAVGTPSIWPSGNGSCSSWRCCWRSQSERAAGIDASTFRILSGYRTPFYNRSIGNETHYSRHVYGDAADIYVDEDGDGTGWTTSMATGGRLWMTRGRWPRWWRVFLAEELVPAVRRRARPLQGECGRTGRSGTVDVRGHPSEVGRVAGGWCDLARRCISRG